MCRDGHRRWWMNRRVVLKTAATVIAGGWGTAACGGPADQPARRSALKTGITLGWHSSGGTDRILEVRSDTARAFEARYPGTKVEVLTTDTNKILAQFAAGTPPDVFSSEPGLM